MKIFLAIVLGLFSITSFGESNRFNLPVYFAENGEIRIISKGESDFTLNPILQVDFEKSSSSFFIPKKVDSFSLVVNKSNSQMVQIDTIRKELGIGIRLRGPIRLGIVPFKGAYQTTSRKRDSYETIRFQTGLPKALGEIHYWNINDEGTYEVYGGLSLTAGIGILSGINTSFSLQVMNTYRVNIRKDSQNIVDVAITEENDKERSIRIGTDGIGLTFSKMKGKLLRMNFSFNLNEKSHIELYQKLLNGDIVSVQKNLPWNSQNLTFIEAKRKLTIGITQVAAETRSWSRFIYPDQEVYLKVKKSKGFLVKSRLHQSFAISEDKGITLLWTSKMKKVDGEALRKHYLNRAERLKLINFNTYIERKAKLGTLHLQMALAFTREELESASRTTLTENNSPLNDRLKAALLNWKEERTYLAEYLLNNPTELTKFLQMNQTPTKVYFKLMSPTFESIEGETLSEL